MTLDAVRIEDRCVILPDVNGFQWHIPVRVLDRIHDRAIRDGRAYYDGRWFDTPTLDRAIDLLPRCDNCHELPGVNRMGDNNDLFCDGCASAAQGSIHDDKTEF